MSPPVNLFSSYTVLANRIQSIMLISGPMATICILCIWNLESLCSIFSVLLLTILYEVSGATWKWTSNFQKSLLKQGMWINKSIRDFINVSSKRSSHDPNQYYKAES